MSRTARFLSFLLLFSAASLPAQDSKIMGEIRFDPVTSIDRDAGIWIDGNYVGYVKELKDDRDKKVLLLPGKHTITAREAGYTDWVSEVVVEPGQLKTLHIKMTPAPGAQEPQVTAQLKVTVQPSRAAVFIDGAYVGHAGELGGALHSLLLAPGKHHIKVSLPGYRSFESDVDLVAGQKSEVKTELLKAPAD
jgi:PEGA domain-containing protein